MEPRTGSCWRRNPDTSNGFSIENPSLNRAETKTRHHRVEGNHRRCVVWHQECQREQCVSRASGIIDSYWKSRLYWWDMSSSPSAPLLFAFLVVDFMISPSVIRRSSRKWTALNLLSLKRQCKFLVKAVLGFRLMFLSTRYQLPIFLCKYESLTTNSNVQSRVTTHVPCKSSDFHY